MALRRTSPEVGRLLSHAAATTSPEGNVNGSQWVAVDGVVSIDDNGGSITIDGTVAATQSGTWNIATVTTLTGITNDVNIADGGNSITVDAVDLDIRALDHVTIGDSVRIGDGTEILLVNTDGSINVNIVTAALSDEFHDADVGSPLANAVSTHTVTAAGGVMIVNTVTVAGSGGVKYVVKNGGTEVMTGFIGRDGNTDIVPFVPAVEVADLAALTIERTNRQGVANDVYSTVMGRQL